MNTPIGMLSGEKTHHKRGRVITSDCSAQLMLAICGPVLPRREEEKLWHLECKSPWLLEHGAAADAAMSVPGNGIAPHGSG